MQCQHEDFAALGVPSSGKGDGINDIHAKILKWDCGVNPPTGGDTVIRNPNHTSANYDENWNK